VRLDWRFNVLVIALIDIEITFVLHQPLQLLFKIVETLDILGIYMFILVVWILLMGLLLFMIIAFRETLLWVIIFLYFRCHLFLLYSLCYQFKFDFIFKLSIKLRRV